MSAFLLAFVVRAATLGAVAHLILTTLTHQILKSGLFSADERNQLWRESGLGVSYPKWRRTMRHHRPADDGGARS